MKPFIAGLLIGLIVAFPLGMNVGKGNPVFSNPFANKPLSEQIGDAAKSASEKLKEKTGELMQNAEDAVNEAAE
ncbi:MAG: hypothetical protein MAG794_00465 [Gammaproteobacteria bacterium]|nr:hypothetical protein [Gammaproteobacteria bacterium]